MPKIKSAKKATETTTTVAKPAPKASEAKGKEVKEAKPAIVDPTWLAAIKPSPLSVSDLKVGEKYVVVKDVMGCPESHFPEVDRSIFSDAALEMTFVGLEDTYQRAGGYLREGDTDKNDPELMEAAKKMTKIKLAIFDDGRSKYADPEFTTCEPDCVPIFVYPTKMRAEAVKAAEFVSAVAFDIGWKRELSLLKTQTMLLSEDFDKLSAWLKDQSLSTLRHAAAVYGGDIKSLFSTGVTREVAADKVIALRKSFKKDVLFTVESLLVPGMAVTPETAKKKVGLKEAREMVYKAWEKSKAEFKSHVNVTKVQGLYPGKNLSDGILPAEKTLRDIEAKRRESKVAEDKARKEAEKKAATPAATVAKPKGKTVEEMKKDAATQKLGATAAKAATEAKIKAADEAAKKIATSTKTDTVKPKVKVKTLPIAKQGGKR